MNIQEEQVDGVHVVRFRDARLDSTCSSALKTELLRLVENEGVIHLLLDLKDVDYVDSSGLGALLFGHRHIKGNKGKMKLVHLSQKVKTLIRIANLEKILEGYDDEKSALAAFRT